MEAKLIYKPVKEDIMNKFNEKYPWFCKEQKPTKQPERLSEMAPKGEAIV